MEPFFGAFEFDSKSRNRTKKAIKPDYALALTLDRVPSTAKSCGGRGTSAHSPLLYPIQARCKARMQAFARETATGGGPNKRENIDGFGCFLHITLHSLQSYCKKRCACMLFFVYKRLKNAHMPPEGQKNGGFGEGFRDPGMGVGKRPPEGPETPPRRGPAGGPNRPPPADPLRTPFPPPPEPSRRALRTPPDPGSEIPVDPPGYIYEQ